MPPRRPTDGDAPSHLKELPVNARRTLLAATVALALPGVLAAQATKTKSAAKPAASGAAAAASATASSTLPSAKQVIASYVKAIGGRDALLARKSVRRTLTLEVPSAGMKADIEASQMAGKTYMKTTMPGLGEILAGFDGTTAWAIDPMQGARLLAGKELDQAKSQSELTPELHESPNLKSIEVVADTTFEGRPAYKVKVVRASGEEVREYFDKENGLLLGEQMTVETPMGPVEAMTIRQDYKQMGGTLVASRQLQRAGGQEFVITLVSVEENKVDPTVFDLPAQIKALVPAPAK
jgi:hypothetical protein